MFESGFHKHVFPDGSTYEGNWLGKKKHGSGTNHYSAGGRYTGEFAHGLRHGTGTYFYPDGDTYTGEFKNGNREGKGKYAFKAGGFYEGGWLKDQMHGHGSAVDANGKTLTGIWCEGRPEGQCWVQDGSAFECVLYEPVRPPSADCPAHAERSGTGSRPERSAGQNSDHCGDGGEGVGGGNTRPSLGCPGPQQLEGLGSAWLTSAFSCISCATWDVPHLRRSATSGPGPPPDASRAGSGGADLTPRVLGRWDKVPLSEGTGTLMEEHMVSL